MSSKRKARYIKYQEREAKREADRKLSEAAREALKSGDIEKMASALGIRLQ